MDLVFTSGPSFMTQDVRLVNEYRFIHLVASSVNAFNHRPQSYIILNPQVFL